MATVHIPPALRALTAGLEAVQAKGATVRQLIENLERTFPGLRDGLLDGNRLRSNLRVAVDGEISPLGLLEPVSPSSEVHFVAAISGGCARDLRWASPRRSRLVRGTSLEPACYDKKSPMIRENVPDVLARIVEYKKRELDKPLVSRHELEQLAEEMKRERRDFRSALLDREIAIIAEIKRASPSRGLIADHLDPAAVAAEYERGGAAALSVVTDGQFFRGSLDDLSFARGAVNLPLLRKDFTIDEYHVVEAAANSADAVLLIASLFTEKRLRQLREYAAHFGMPALVEVHDEEELRRALDSGAGLVGVNNRDLRTFEVRLETSFRLASLMPSDIIKVSESGIRTREDIRKLRQAGYDAFLIGEHLMRSRDRTKALRELVG